MADILNIINNPSFDQLAALKNHHVNLEKKRTQFEQLIATVEKTIAYKEAKKLVMKHKEWLMYSWTTYSKEAHAGLAEMYVTDDRFTAYYDKHIEGGAEFLRDAIVAYVKGN